MVVDISPGGLCIRTAVPLDVGDPVEVEVYPRDGADRDNVILVRGRVARVSGDGGDYAMGVHLRLAGGRTGPRPPGPGREQVRQIMDRLPGRMRGGDADAPSPLAWAEHRAGEAETPVVFRRRRTRRGRWLALLLALLVLLAAGGWWAWQERGAGESPRPPEYGHATLSTPDGSTDVVSALPVASETPALPGEEAAAPRFARADRRGAVRLARAQQQLAAGQAEAAHAAFHALAEDPEHDDLSRFVARLGTAWALALMDRPEDARAAVGQAVARAASDEGGTIPETWAAVARSMQADLAQGDPPWTALGFLVDALVLGGLRAAPEAPAEDGVPVRIEVDTAGYTLTVWRGGLVLGRFPVGLGQDGATPAGTFALVNKIRDPAWYNRGNVVPPDDPENPLGGLWMGLADGDGPTPIGIHPTDEAASIGTDQSAGCIRMRPEDAERVFRWCPVGTPVTVTR